MPTPSKPANVIKMEGKSHRTKAEIKQREQAEKNLVSGTAMKERPEVKDDEFAHKEYGRISKLFKKMGKNDAIYEVVLNRYCMIQAECYSLERERKHYQELLEELHSGCKLVTQSLNIPDVDKAMYMLEYSKEFSKSMKCVLAIDSEIRVKRKMLLDIEKECVMTVASALRSIPKKVEKKKNALQEALNG